MRLRKDGSLSPLFINKQSIVPIGKWINAKCHPTPGFKVRKGWHILAKPNAPHLSKKGRIWVKVEMAGITELQRPKAQGGLWYLANKMRIVKVMNRNKNENYR